jgi:excisionase family DNA binding protein
MHKNVATQHDDGPPMRIKVFAKRVDHAEKTVRRWVAEGKVGHIRYGRSIRIPLSELNRLNAEGHRPAKS